MDVRIVDLARNTSVALTKSYLRPDVNYGHALDALIAGQFTQSGRVEIQCDKEFYDALEAEADSRENILVPVDGETHHPTYHGVPIVVRKA